MPKVAVSRTVSAASTNATSVKAGASTLYGVLVNNVNAAVRYLKIYDHGAAPTVGTTPIALTLAVPAGQVTSIQFPAPVTLAKGLAFAMTTEATDAGTTGVAVSEHVIHLFYT